MNHLSMQLQKLYYLLTEIFEHCRQYLFLQMRICNAQDHLLQQPVSVWFGTREFAPNPDVGVTGTITTAKGRVDGIAKLIYCPIGVGQYQDVTAGFVVVFFN